MLFYKKIVNYFKSYKTELLKTVAVFVTFCIISNLLMSLEKVNGEILEYQSWKQTDSRWADKWLCSNRYEQHTMAQIGCAATSAAILCVHSGSVTDSNFNPGRLCDYLYDNGGFDEDGDIIWGKIQGIVPDFVYQKPYNIGSVSEEKLISELSALLKEGYYIVLTCKPNNGHWVAVDKVTSDDVLIMDPGSGATSLFSRYSAKDCTTARLFFGTNSSKIADPGVIIPSNNDLGYYSVTATTLNHRTGPATSYTSNGTIPQGTSVNVTETENGWGKFVYNNKTGWSSMEYMEKVLMGDLNDDKIVNNKDAAIILAYRRGKYKLTEEQFYAADMNFDGVVDQVDGAKITKIALK
jgi:hypothetical protein